MTSWLDTLPQYITGDPGSAVNANVRRLYTQDPTDPSRWARTNNLQKIYQYLGTNVGQIPALSALEWSPPGGPTDSVTTQTDSVTTQSLPEQPSEPGVTSSSISDVLSQLGQGVLDFGTSLSDNATAFLGAYAPILAGAISYLTGEQQQQARDFLESIARGQLADAGTAFNAFMQQFGNQIPADKLAEIQQDPLPNATRALEQYSQTGIPSIEQLRDERLAEFKQATSGLTNLEETLVGRALDRVSQQYAPLLNAYGISGTTAANVLAQRGAEAADAVLLQVEQAKANVAATALQYGLSYDTIVNDARKYVADSWADLDKAEADIQRAIYDSLTGADASRLTTLGNLAGSLYSSGADAAEAFADQDTGTTTALATFISALPAFASLGSSPVNVTNVIGGQNGQAVNSDAGAGGGGTLGDLGSGALDALSDFGQGAALLATGVIPGQWDDAAVEWIAKGGLTNLPSKGLDAVKSIGQAVKGWFGGAEPLVGAGGTLTETGTAAVNQLMATGVSADDAITAVMASDPSFYGGASGGTGGGLSGALGAGASIAAGAAGNFVGGWLAEEIGFGTSALTDENLSSGGQRAVSIVANVMGAAGGVIGSLLGGTPGAGLGAAAGRALGEAALEFGVKNPELATLGAIVSPVFVLPAIGAAIGGIAGDGTDHGSSKIRGQLDRLHALNPELPDYANWHGWAQEHLKDANGNPWIQNKHLEKENEGQLLTVAFLEDIRQGATGAVLKDVFALPDQHPEAGGVPGILYRLLSDETLAKTALAVYGDGSGNWRDSAAAIDTRVWNKLYNEYKAGGGGRKYKGTGDRSWSHKYLNPAMRLFSAMVGPAIAS
jgi:hypothetical protein